MDKGGDGTTLLVRARRRGDLERVFPEAEVKETPRNDYRFRARLPRERVAQALAEAARGITYPNFKATVHERGRHDAYLDTWSVLHAWQERGAPRDPS